MRPVLLIAVTLLICGLLRQEIGPKRIEPPFVRQWTALTGYNTAVIAAREGVVYYRSEDGVGAIDLDSGKLKWSCLANTWIPSAVFQGRTLYAIAHKEKATTLQVIDIATGQTRTLFRLPTGGSALGSDAEQIYLLDDHGKLWAYSLNSEKPLWSRQLSPLPLRERGRAQMAVTTEGVYVGIDGQGDFGINKKDGAILWSRALERPATYPLLVVGGDVITQAHGLTRIAMRTGQIVWKDETGGNANALVADVVIGAGRRSLLGRDAATGHIRWTFPLIGDLRELYTQSLFAQGENAWIGHAPLLNLTKDGKESWHSAYSFRGRPAYVDRERIVTTDVNRILGYASGTLPPLPDSEPEKKALAERLAAQYENLDDTDRKQLEQLVPYAFPLLLARYVEWAKAEATEPDDRRSLALYSLLTDMPPLLLTTCRREDTAAIVSAWSELGEKSSWRYRLENLLMAKGDPAGYIPILVKNLRSLSVKERWGSTSIEAVAHSSHPEAVAFMLEVLRDPQSPPGWRWEAFVHLAGTGGEAGVRAVLAARAKPGPRKPWFDTIDLAHLPQKDRVSVKTDARGRTWMLFHSDVLGNRGDLFLVQKLGTQWGRPLFTGARTKYLYHEVEAKTFRDIPIDKLISTEWIKIFPDDPSIRRDTDRDGLTDLVEARLGTDPNKKDTDGDGLTDLVDPCPNAAPRPLGDTEKIIAACIEARFFESKERAPAVLSVDNVKPFKLYGYPSPLFWGDSRWKLPLSEVSGGGVNSLTFYSPMDSPAHEQGFIHYDADHRTAHTFIRRDSGGLDGDGSEVTLRKIGDEWFVIDFETVVVS